MPLTRKDERFANAIRQMPLQKVYGSVIRYVADQIWPEPVRPIVGPGIGVVLPAPKFSR